MKRFLLLAALLCSAWLQAQQLDSPLKVPVTFEGRYTAAAEGWSEFSIAFDSSTVSSAYALDYYDWVEAPRATAMLRPGLNHVFVVDAVNASAWEFHIAPVPGYTVFMENIHRRKISSSSSYEYISVRLERERLIPAGEATDLRPGRVVWSVGLGGLSNGRPAGEISLRENGLSATTFTPAALIYDSESTEAYPIWINGQIRQVKAAQCLVDVVTESANAFILKFIKRSDVGSQNGDGTWNWSGTPFIEYRIQNPEPGTYDKLRITQTNRVSSAAFTRTRWTELRRTASGWDLIPWNEETSYTASLSKLSLQYSGTTEQTSLLEANNTLVSYSEQTLSSMPWGSEITSSRQGATTLSNPLLSSFSYDTDSSSGGYGQLAIQTMPTGNWVRYDFHNDMEKRGLLWHIYRPFLNSPSNAQLASTTSGDVTTFSYTEDWTGKQCLPYTVKRYLNGTMVSSKAYSYAYQTINGRPVIETMETVSTSPTSTESSVTWAYRADADPTDGFWPGLMHALRRPDGSMQAHVYLKGSFDPSTRAFTVSNSGTERMHLAIEGTNQSSGATALSTWAEGDQSYSIGSYFYVVPNKSTLTAVVSSATGAVLSEQTKRYDGSGWALVSRTAYTHLLDLEQFVTENKADSGTVSSSWTNQTSTFSGGFLSSQKDASGITLDHSFDSLGRISMTCRSSVSGQPGGSALYTLYAYDAAGRMVGKRQSPSSSTTPSEDDSEVTTQYDTAGRVVNTTVNAVSGSTSTTAQTTFAYHVDSDPLKSQVTQPDGTTVITLLNLDGRVASVTGTAKAPAYYSYIVQSDGRLRTQSRLSSSLDGDGWSDVYTDRLGRVERSVTPAFGNTYVQTVNTYNGFGQLTKTQMLDSAGSPLTAPTLCAYNSMGQLLETGLDLNENGTLDEASADRITRFETDYAQVDGQWWLRNRKWTLSENNASTTILTQKLSRLARLETSSGVFENEERTVDANNQTITNKTYVNRNAARVWTETTVPGSSTLATRVLVNGLLKYERSSTGAGVSYEYDNYTRLSRLYRRVSSENGTSSDYEARSYYAGTSLVQALGNYSYGTSSDWQNFEYDLMARPTRHQITNDLRAEGRYFAYTPHGALWRQWGPGIQPVEYTTNAYGWRTGMNSYRGGSGWDQGTWPTSPGDADTTNWDYNASTGQCVKKTYPLNGTRTEVNFEFNARGQVSKRTWGRGAYATYSYKDASGYRTGELYSVGYSDSTPAVTYAYNESRTGQVTGVTDATGTRSFEYRGTDMQLDYEQLPAGFFTLGGTEGVKLTQTYDSLGRSSGFQTGVVSIPAQLQTVGYAYQTATGRLETVSITDQAGTRSFITSYLANTDWVESLSSGSFARTNTWSTWRPALDSVQTTWLGTNKARYEYTLDHMAQRDKQTETGDLFVDLGYQNGRIVDLTLNARSELGEQRSHVRNADGSQGSEIPALQRIWGYDTAGNRSAEAREGGSAVAWGANSLNQITNAGYWGNSFDYDADGNMVGDLRWWYYYDAENRLIAMRSKPGQTARSLRFTYDYMGRRVRKEVWTNADYSGAAGTDIKFIWQGYNLVAETNASGTVLRSYAWGLDASGTVHGAGGVGGLLQATVHSGSTAASYLPVIDGSGNVQAMLNTSGAYAEIYHYTAFGENYGRTDSLGLPFRFATKYRDAETELYQYNHRYYAPIYGRFINRDPIEENGGLNLYAYCGNGPVNSWDMLGQYTSLERLGDHFVYEGEADPSWIFKGFHEFGGAIYADASGMLYYNRLNNHVDCEDELSTPGESYYEDSYAEIDRQNAYWAGLDAKYAQQDANSQALLAKINASFARDMGLMSRGIDPGQYAGEYTLTTSKKSGFDTGVSIDQNGFLVSVEVSLYTGAPDNELASDFLIQSVLEAGQAGALASNGNTRGVNIPRTSPLEVEEVMMRRINKERDPVLRGRMQDDLKAFRYNNGLNEPRGPRDAEFRRPGQSGSYNFPSSEQLSRMLQTDAEIFHRVTKPQIIRDFWTELQSIGCRNPNIGVDQPGNIILQSPQTGRTINTNVPLSSYGGGNGGG